MDLISIIIPVYNTGKYLANCLDSCLNQTYTNLEIIVIDDHSTDPLTIEILQKYQSKDDRLKVIFEPENHGQGFCRNEGLKYIHGKYFAYIDSDDTFVPNAIEHLHNTIVQYQTDFVQSDVHNTNAEDLFSFNEGFVPADINEKCRNVFNFRGQENIVFNLPQFIADGMLFNVPALCYGKLFNTARYLEANVRFDDGPYSRHCQDEDWSTSMLLKLNSFVYTKFVSIVRFILKNSASTPSVKYYKSALAACARRFKLVDQPHLPCFYKYSVLQFALERARTLLKVNTNPAEHKALSQFAIDFLKDYSPTFLHYIYQTSSANTREIYTIQNLLTYAYYKRPFVCYFSLQSLFDTTDSEVLAVGEVLEHLASCGFNVCTLTGSLSLKNKGNGRFDNYATRAKRSNAANSISYMPGLRHFFHNGVNHHGISLSYSQLKQEHIQSPKDSQVLAASIRALFSYSVPDILIYSGSDHLTRSIVNELARTQGSMRKSPQESDGNSKPNMSIVYLPLHNTLPADVPFCDLVATFTEYQAQAYRKLLPQSPDKVKHLGYTPFPTWNFCPNTPDRSNQAFYTTLGTSFTLPEVNNEQDNQTLPAPNDKGSVACYDYLGEVKKIDNQHLAGSITLLSPEFDQGLAIFIGLVMYCSQAHPDLEFVIIDSPSGSAAQNIAKLHTQEGQLLTQLQPNLSKLKIFPFADNLTQVYAKTKVLLHLPMGLSLEAITPLYATWQGIKVLTTDHPLIAEVLTNSIPSEQQPLSFAQIQLPSTTLSDQTCLPTEQEMSSIVQTLEPLLKSAHTALPYSEQKAQVLTNLDKWQAGLKELLPEHKVALLNQLYRLV